MAEKPRLKETDEIFNVIGKSPAKARPLPISQETPDSGREGPDGQGGMSDGMEAPARRAISRAAGRRMGRIAMPQEAETEDAEPLDFSKYSFSGQQNNASGQDPAQAEDRPSQIDSHPEDQLKEPEAGQVPEPPRQNARSRRRADPSVSGEAVPVPQIRRINPPVAAKEPEFSPVWPVANTSASASIEGPVEPPAMSEKTQSPASRKEGPVEPSRAERPERSPASVEEPDISMEKAVGQAAKAAEPAADFMPVSAPVPTEAEREIFSVSPKETKTYESQATSGKKISAREQAPPPPPAVRPFVFEKLADIGAPDPEAKAAEPQPQPVPVPQKEPERPEPRNAAPETGQAPEEKVTSPEKQALLKQLSSKFEEAFEDIFEGREPGGELPRAWRKPRGREKDLREASRKPPQEPPIPIDILPDDREAELEAESFMQEFAQKVKREEEDRKEMFKDTLAEKFERERQRYLKELGIDPSQPPRMQAPEPEAFTPPVNRRLDIQIDPEMHRQPEEKQPEKKQAEPPQGGVTYSRGGEARPLRDAPQEPDTPEAARPVSSGKKSAEELLLELARQKSQPAAARPAPRGTQQPRPEPAQPPQTLRFVPVGADKKKNKAKAKAKTGGNGKIAVISTIVAAVILVAIAIPTIQWLFPELTQPRQGESNSSGAPAANEAGTTLEVYETRLFSEGRGEYDNILIKRANLSVKNVSVRDNLVIMDAATAGEILLEDIAVGGTITLQNCAVDSLVLRNVAADRVVINNPGAQVSLSLGGYGTVGTLEIRTPATVQSVPTQGASIDNVRSVILRAAPESPVLNVRIDGLQLQTLASFGETVLELGEDSTAERLTSEGATSISGNGRIIAMSAGPQNPGERLVLNLGAPVTGLDIKGKSEINVSGQIDSLVAEEDLTITGTGRISNLVLNPSLGGGRLLVEVYDVGIATLIANAEAQILASGNARINELTANESVYALGNKVNLLVVNANGVIYENEPDKLQTAAGIRPADSKANNPNLDYSLATSQIASPADTSQDDFSTVCGHPRESGGFLTGDGSASAPYQVGTPAQLAHVSLHLSSHFEQTADIDIALDSSFTSGFPMIASGGTSFSGSYDGMGLRITNLRISSTAENVGLFAENTGVIQNVNLASGEIKSASTSRNFVGGVAGLNYQNGSISACSNGARVIGATASYVGGITGYNYAARIKDCYNAAKITGIANVGGIAGVNRDAASISGCYNAGTIEGGTSDTGAIAGVNTSGVITNTYYLADTAKAGIGTGGGTAVEKDTDAMSSAQMVADLAAGNDASLWGTGSGDYTYPMLRRPDAVQSRPQETRAPQAPPASAEPQVTEVEPQP